MDLTDKYSTCHIKTKEYKFFLYAHRMFSRIDHTVGQKTSLNTFKKIESYRVYFIITMGWNRNQLQKKKLENQTGGD